MSESFLSKFFSVLKCGVCGRNYEADAVKVVGHEEDLWFVCAYCNACHTQGLIVAMVEKRDTDDEATDLSEDEYDRFDEAEAVCTNDVVDMHNFLKGFNGDFVGLFATE